MERNRKEEMATDHEIVCLHVGQAGVQTGSATWELYCLEHGISPQGVRAARTPQSGNVPVLFSQATSGVCVPRAVLVDLDPTVIDEVRRGPYRNLFHPSSLVSGKEDASSNFARGYYTVGNEISELVSNRLRQQAEECNSLQGFIIYRSLGGGTGSGLTPNLLSKLARDYCKKTRIEVAVYPSPQMSPVIVEPYNTVLTTHSSMTLSDCCFIVDNEAIYDICANQLDVNKPTYTNLNRIIGQVMAGVTCSLRFPSGANTTLSDLKTNLVPYPRLHYPLVTYAPLLPQSRAAFDTWTAEKLVSSCFQPESQMIKCDPRKGKYVSCCLLFRGDLPPSDINQAIARAKENRRITFVEFSPAGFKVSVCPKPPVTVPGGDLAQTDKAVVMLSNTSAIATVWENINRKFRLMYNKRAFVHHYVGEGMEEGEFRASLEDLEALETDYRTMFR